jgi:hypothetical protein
MVYKPLLWAALTVLLTDCAAAQDVRNVSGVWQKDSTRSDSAAEGSPANAEVPMKLVIEQTDTTVRVERHRRDGRTDVITYHFAEPPRVAAPPIPTGTVGRAVDHAGAEWKDGRLLLTTLLHVNGMAVSTVERVNVLSEREIQVETQLQMHHGYEGNSPEATAGSTGRDVYFRAAR